MSPILKLGSLIIVLLLVAACGAGSPTSTPLPISSATPLPAQPTTVVAQPTAEPTTVVAQPTTPPSQQVITLDLPQAGQSVSGPVEVQGSFTVWPFEATLRGRVYDAAGQVVGEGPVMTTAPVGQPGTFRGAIPFTVRAGGPGRVEIADISPKDGAVLGSASVDVTLAAPPAAGPVEIPAANARVTLPLHILARAGQPGEQVTAALTWQDGTTLKQNLPVLRGEDGQGLVLGSIDWMNEGPPPMPDTQPATLELWNQAGDRVGSQPVTVLNPQDPDVRQVMLYFVLGESLQPIQRNIPKTEGIGAAALDELLWGPPPNNLAGFTTAIPTPEEVMQTKVRQPGWGPRVKLLKLTIVDGVATADFSKELNAYGGGSLRVKLIHDQIAQTLMQFPTVTQVVIAVEGQTEGVLQP